MRTYKANHFADPDNHSFNDCIRKVTLSDREDVTPDEVDLNIDSMIPDHYVLLVGFPCQPFLIAGVSKKMRLAGFMALTARHRALCFSMSLAFLKLNDLLPDYYRRDRPITKTINNSSHEGLPELAGFKVDLAI
jgi:site-specific DNA-cytosine methylase